MRNNVLKYTLLVSLLLNFSFLGAAGYTHYRQVRYPFALVGQGAQGPTLSGSAAPSHLFEEVSLKPEQLRLFQEKAGTFHETLDQKKTNVDRLRGALFDLMRADHADPKAFEATIAEINRAQHEIQEIVVAHMLEFKSMLDTDQQKKFFSLIEGSMTGRKGMQCP